jgi:small subunit ribosomal protein S5
MINVPLTKSLSIPHEVSANYGAAKVLLKPSSLGSGVLAGGATRIVLELSGIQSISAKQLGSKNLLNNAKATIKALSLLRI